MSTEYIFFVYEALKKKTCNLTTFCLKLQLLCNLEAQKM